MRHQLLLKSFSALALVGSAGCGADNRTINETEGGTAVENATLAMLSLTSDAFQDGGAIPARYTCDGANQSPGLSWGEPPAGTKSFALVVDDPDAPNGTYRHWGAYDIPASTRSIAAGQSVGSPVVNDAGKPGYGGPCPPKGHGPHHYHFKLFALNVARLDVSPNPKVLDVETAAIKRAIGQAELLGTYERR